MDYSDLDLHLACIINEAWATGNTKPFSQYMPHTAKVAGQLIRAVKQSKCPPAPKEVKHNQHELDTLRAFLAASMKVEHERASEGSDGSD